MLAVGDALLNDNGAAKVDVLRANVQLAQRRVDLAVLNRVHAVHAQELGEEARGDMCNTR